MIFEHHTESFKSTFCIIKLGTQVDKKGEKRWSRVTQSQFVIFFISILIVSKKNLLSLDFHLLALRRSTSVSE